MIPRGVKYYGKGGSKNRPCNQCTYSRKEHCDKYEQCELYRRWLNASWKDFRKAAGVSEK